MKKEKNENRENIKKARKENKNKTEEKNEEENKKSKINKETKTENETETKKLPEELKKRLRNNFFIAVGIIIYFGILILAHAKMKLNRLSCDIEIFASVFLLLGIYMLEKSYKKDNGKVAINAIELFVCFFVASLTIGFSSLTISEISLRLSKYSFLFLVYIIIAFKI